MTSPRMSPSVGDWAEGRCTPRAYVRCFDFRHYRSQRSRCAKSQLQALTPLIIPSIAGAFACEGASEVAFCIRHFLPRRVSTEAQGASTTLADSPNESAGFAQHDIPE